MIFRKLTIIWHALGVRGFLPIEFLTRFDRQEPRQKFSYAKPFSSARNSKIFVTKMTPKISIFVQRFFRSGGPYAA